MKEKEDILKNQISIGEEKSQTIAHKDEALKRLDTSFNKHIELLEYKKSNLLAYWIKDFANYHDQERYFDASKLKVFKRGDIIKANLGFNIGSELGGLHYCVVITKKDSPYSNTLNIIPLSSTKENKKYNASTCIELGDELYLSLKQKYNKELEKVQEEITNMNKTLPPNKLQELLAKMNYLDKVEIELTRMKHGSIALIHQITTISKQRIFNTKDNILSGIKIADKSLDLIDSKIMELFTK